MAELIFTPSGADGFVNKFERQVVEALCAQLPAHWQVAANLTIKPRSGRALEMDAVVFAEATVFVVEAKGWTGRVAGDDQEWEVGKRPLKCPLLLTNHKSRSLASMLDEHKASVDTMPVLVVPDAAQLALHGNWAEHAVHLCDLAGWLMRRDEVAGRKGEAPERAAARMKRVVALLQGRWAVRNRSARRSIGPYLVVETLERDDRGGVYLAAHGQFSDDGLRYRVRTWQVAPTAAADGTDRQLRWMFRSAEARQRIGEHDNVLRVLFFEHDTVESEFVEVTPWPPGGSLHRFLTGSEAGASSLATRLAIATGIAEALKALHAAGVVHRNVQPKAILLTEARVPKLTDFERAHMEGETTVYSDSRGRTETAYIAPELFSPTAFDSSPGADCYALGVILYQLLTGQLPFADPTAAEAAGGLPARLPSQWAPGLDPRLDELVVALLHSGPGRNRPTADEAVRRLREIALPPVRTVVPVPEAAPAAPAAARAGGFAVGTVLDGRWRLDARLGEGSFAQVFRVRHLNQGVDYAMKIFVGLADRELALHEFNQVRPRIPVHPNLRQIVWLDRLNEPFDNIYMVAELIDGSPLECWTRGERSMPWQQQREVASSMLRALGAIHAAGVVHRDVKPANILIEEKTGRALLIDFNVASAELDFDGGHGTRLYRAPDVSRVGWGPHADLFSLAIVLFELFFGAHPFAELRLGEAARNPRSILGFAGVSDEVVAFFARALHLQAEHRFVRASEMLAALPDALFLGEPSPARALAAAAAAEVLPTPVRLRAERWLRHNLVWLIAAVVALIGAEVVRQVMFLPESPAPSPAAPLAAPSRFDHRGCPDGFVRVPAGSFRMGKEVWEKVGYKDEAPAHTVSLSRDLCFQQHEVRQREWALLMGSNPAVHTGCGEDCPVDSITWREATAFANARSAAEQRPVCYEGDRLVGLTCGGYRLPTEAEWEYAARAGEDRAAEVAIERIAWHKGNARETPHPVGELQPNAWGLYDTIGNVWEWTNDRYGPYEAGALLDPTGPAQGSIRVRRGGAWNSFPMVARVGNRGNALSQTQRQDSTGLRLVVLPKE